MFFIIIAWDKPGVGELRRKTKLAHKANLDAGASSVRVLQSGPLLTLTGLEHGSLIVVDADSIAAAQAFAGGDPYVAAGVFQSVEVHRWAWQRGNPYLPTASVAAP